MGSVGDCFDNAMCESFFATLECELLNRRHFKTQIEARMAIFDFIEGFYNPHRRHSALGYRSPCEYESAYRGEPDQTTRSSPAPRNAWPPDQSASAAPRDVAASDPKPTTLSGPPLNQAKGGAEKLVSQQQRHRETLDEIKPMS